jgi:hypothetical protein
MSFLINKNRFYNPVKHGVKKRLRFSKGFLILKPLRKK